jgi:hypothetical protein
LGGLVLRPPDVVLQQALSVVKLRSEGLLSNPIETEEQAKTNPILSPLYRHISGLAVGCDGLW